MSKRPDDGSNAVILGPEENAAVMARWAEDVRASGRNVHRVLEQALRLGVTPQALQAHMDARSAPR